MLNLTVVVQIKWGNDDKVHVDDKVSEFGRCAEMEHEGVSNNRMDVSERNRNASRSSISNNYEVERHSS